MFVRRPTRLPLIAWLVIAAWALACGAGQAATSSTVVGATVLSATNIGTGGCPTGSLGVTNFGPLTAGSSTVTTGNCVVTFGSSNDVARLRIAQGDRLGSAMYRLSSGAADTTWSGNGVETFAPSGGDDVASSVAVQADGKVIVAGTVDDAGTRRPMVARIDTTGTLDGTFGTGGIRSFPTLSSHIWSQPQVTVDPQGRIVLAFVDGVAAAGTAKIVRLLANGADDGSFGTAGLVTHAMSGANSAWINDVVVDASGRILLGGRAWPAVEWNWLSVVLRFTDAGVIDNTLGGDGIIAHICPGATTGDGATDLIAHADGSITVASVQLNGTTKMHVGRLTPTGGLDGTFGTGGCTAMAGNGGSGLATDAAGRFLVGTQAGVVRLSSAGLVDNTFGTLGTAAIGGTPRELAVDVDGSIIAGWLNGSIRTTRLSTTGTLVARHGSGGTAAITVGGDAGINDVTDMALAPDGHIVQVAKDTSNGTAFDIVAVRRESSRVANYQAGVNDWTAGGANGVFGACLRNATLGAISDGTTWSSNLGVACPASNGAIWRGIPETTSDPAALIARTTTSTTTTGTATLQFGLRTATSQPPGEYLAPVTFEVVAP